MKRVLEGLTIVTVGGLLLANTLGYLSWSVWVNILSLWPLLLVAIGIDIIGRSAQNVWLRALSSLIVIGGLLYGGLAVSVSDGWWPWTGFMWDSEANAPRTSEPFSSSVPADPGISSGRAKIDGGIGEITVRAGFTLAAIDGETPFGEPSLDWDKSGSSVDVRVTSSDGRGFLGSRARRSFMNVELSRDVAWDLELNVGVSELDADLSDLKLTAMRLETGVSDSTLKLGRPVAAAVPVTVEGGVSSFVVRLPRGEAVKLRLRKGLADVDVPGGFEKQPGADGEEVWSTPGLGSAQESWDVQIEAGISRIDVEWY